MYQAIRPNIETALLTVFGVSIGCKHTPTCSVFMQETLIKDGTITGVGKACWRALTCIGKL